uniref:Homeobox domain-containing protein n=1 Tax=Steinernema glaseri TaxID=37863 RepID=A0A1I7Z557_9BILA
METIPEEDHEKLSASGSHQCLTSPSYASSGPSTRTIESKSRLKEVYTSEQVDTLVTYFAVSSEIAIMRLNIIEQIFHTCYHTSISGFKTNTTIALEVFHADC